MKKTKVLIVDDSENDILLLTIYLKQIGIGNENILSCTNGKESIDLYKKHKNEIKLILSDIQLPGINGYEVIKQIHKINPKVPIILETATSIQEFPKAGHLGYLLKPYTKSQLFELLKELKLI